MLSVDKGVSVYPLFGMAKTGCDTILSICYIVVPSENWNKV